MCLVSVYKTVQLFDVVMYKTVQLFDVVISVQGYYVYPDVCPVSVYKTLYVSCWQGTHGVPKRSRSREKPGVQEHTICAGMVVISFSGQSRHELALIALLCVLPTRKRECSCKQRELPPRTEGVFVQAAR